MTEFASSPGVEAAAMHRGRGLPVGEIVPDEAARLLRPPVAGARGGQLIAPGVFQSLCPRLWQW